MNSYSIWTKVDRFPPVLVRLLATRPGDRTTLLSDEEIVSRSGGTLRYGDVKHLSYLPSWDDVPLRVMRAFCRACDVDFADPARMRTLTRYLKGRPKWAHLRRHRNYPEFRRMLGELL